jgi:hypothetical protein
MREKRLVNFRAKMPRDSSAGRGRSNKRARDEEGDQAPSSKVGKTEAGGDDTWTRSRCSEKDILHLVAERLLQEKGMVEWSTPFSGEPQTSRRS